jgi:hypothetical protein
MRANTLTPRFRRALEALQPLEVEPGLFVGASPDARGVEALERAGFRSIVDLDVEGDPGQGLSPNVEASWAHTFELEHHRVAFYGPSAGQVPPPPGDLARLREAIAAAPRPTYVECADRARAAALVESARGA